MLSTFEKQVFLSFVKGQSYRTILITSALQVDDVTTLASFNLHIIRAQPSYSDLKIAASLENLKNPEPTVLNQDLPKQNQLPSNNTTVRINTDDASQMLGPSGELENPSTEKKPTVQQPQTPLRKSIETLEPTTEDEELQMTSVSSKVKNPAEIENPTKNENPATDDGQQNPESGPQPGPTEIERGTQKGPHLRSRRLTKKPDAAPPIPVKIDTTAKPPTLPAKPISSPAPTTPPPIPVKIDSTVKPPALPAKPISSPKSGHATPPPIPMKPSSKSELSLMPNDASKPGPPSKVTPPKEEHPPKTDQPLEVPSRLDSTPNPVSFDNTSSPPLDGINSPIRGDITLIFYRILCMVAQSCLKMVRNNFLSFFYFVGSRTTLSTFYRKK